MTLTHRCPVEQCTHAVPQPFVICGPHMDRVPVDLRLRLRLAYGSNLRESAQFQATLAMAVKAAASAAA